MALGRKTGGRPKGGKNKRTLAREQALLNASVVFEHQIEGAFDGTAHEFLIATYKNPRVPYEIRVDAAKCAIRFESAPLAPVQPPATPESEAARAQRLHQLLKEMRATVGGAECGARMADA